MRILKDGKEISVEELKRFVGEGNYYSAYLIAQDENVKVVQGIRITNITDTVYWETDDDEVVIYPQKYRDYEFIDADDKTISIEIDNKYCVMKYDIVISC